MTWLKSWFLIQRGSCFLQSSICAPLSPPLPPVRAPWENRCPPDWRGKQVNTGTHNLPEQKPMSRNLSRTQYWGKKTWTAIDELLEAQYGQIWEIQGDLVIRGSHTFVNFTSRNSTRLSQWISEEEEEKNALMLSAGWGEKEPFWNMSQHSGLLSKAHGF